MTDRELLELAAKAAGYGLPGPDDHDEIGRQELDGLWVKFPWGWDWWRPLFNDGDALRLAVKLFLFFDSAAGAPDSFGAELVRAGNEVVDATEPRTHHDPYAAHAAPSSVQQQKLEGT